MSLNYYHDAPLNQLVAGASVVSVTPEDATSTRYTLYLSNGCRLLFTSVTNPKDGPRVMVSVLPNARALAPASDGKEIES